MIKKYLNKKISSYIAIGIILVAAIFVARFSYWGYMDILEEIYEVVEVKISEKGEKITFYSGCSDVADLWTNASKKEKMRECNKILSDQFELKYEGSESRNCNLIKAEERPCSPVSLGTRLVCIYECREGERRKDY